MPGLHATCHFSYGQPQTSASGKAGWIAGLASESTWGVLWPPCPLEEEGQLLAPRRVLLGKWKGGGHFQVPHNQEHGGEGHRGSPLGPNTSVTPSSPPCGLVLSTLPVTFSCGKAACFLLWSCNSFGPIFSACTHD